VSAEVGVERKLAAILCADVFGYSRLMGEDEEATLRSLSAHRKIIDGLIEQHHGRFVNSAGDSVLAEFASVVNAVQCAVEAQSALKTENAEIPPERRMEFRIGVNLGDVMIEGEQIYGDGVNVAARLESLAEPGGICISDNVYAQVRNKLALSYDDLGEQMVKNIAEPVRVFRIATGANAAEAIKKTQRVPRKYVRRGVFSIAGLAIIVAAIVFVQHLSLRPPTPSASIPPEQSPALPLPDKPSIAVLPFANMSGDREQDYFSDGITDDLTTALSRLPDLFVIARTSAFTYKGKALKVQEISRQLGVKYVLEGSVRKADKQVRITAQLVDATTGDHLWAERYDRPLRDIFALQDEIVRRIVTTLKLQLILEEQGVLVRKQTDNLDAYDNFLRGLEYFWTSTKEANVQARRMFEKAIELDPKYADAYAWLAYNYFVGWAFQLSSDRKDLDRALQSAQRSVALDDSQPFAHSVLGIIFLFKKQYDQALSEAQRGIALDPGSALGYEALSDIMNNTEKRVEAIDLAEKAMRLDPRNHDSYLYLEGWAYTQMGRYEEAIPILKRNLASYPNMLPSHYLLAVDYIELGREPQARAEAAEILRISPNFSVDAFIAQFPNKDEAYKQRASNDLHKAFLK
jgi:adenylate cyclase